MQELKEKLRQAQQNFDYADENYIDAAIYELKTTEEKFSAMLREKRREKKWMKYNVHIFYPGLTGKSYISIAAEQDIW